MSRNCRSFTCTNTDLLKHLSEGFNCLSYSCCMHVQANCGSFTVGVKYAKSSPLQELFPLLWPLAWGYQLCHSSRLLSLPGAVAWHPAERPRPLH